MVEEFPSDPMERTEKIMRKSVSTFLKHFHYFTTTPVLLVLPFSSSVLISQPLFSSSASSKFSLFLSHDHFSRSFISPSIFVIPFALSSLLIAKASVINRHKLASSQATSLSFLSLYRPLLLTHLLNIILCISIHITSTFLLLIIIHSLGSFGFFTAIFRTVCGIFLYAFVTNIILLCNLALVVAGMENCSGCKAIYRAYLLRKGKNSMALIFWAFLTNLGLASVEALFCFRLVRPHQRPSLSIALEGLLIAYLYSIIIVLDTIACCFFIKSRTPDSSTENGNGIYNQIELV
ncbi:hypothetical protein L484_020951 [Morus notabilis]|uniref:Uncharacterized protein n=1 Tax=Morus notabilis TaxID=981085 RepID=W9QI87_9ROSA|nr:uncharacterized protein LOC21403821 [Morus notabilis]EXB38032.1 hypothetical protein L484_020951 [Morus notabilis]